MFCISISHKYADYSIRKRLAFSEESQREFISELINKGEAEECVLVCTCNRTEVYLCGSENSFRNIIRLLAKFSSISEENLIKYVMTFYGDGAVKHLFKVCCGIESMVIGEDEILGQIKKAYYRSKEMSAVKSRLNMIFQSAVSCAKKIKTCTALSKTSVSTATLAANEAARLGNNVNAVLIGATGKIGLTVLKNLLSHKNINTFVTLRSHNSDLETLNCEYNFKTVDYSDRYSLFDCADCVISATSSPHFTVTASELKRSIHTKKSRLFIDLAVPHDIDENIIQIGGIKLLGIDCFEELAKENNALKLDSVESAKRIIEEETNVLKKSLAFHDFVPQIADVKAGLAGKPLEEILYKLKSQCGADDFVTILNALRIFGGNV